MSTKFQLILFLAALTLGFCSIIPFDAEANVIDLHSESSGIELDVEDDILPSLSLPEVKFPKNLAHLSAAIGSSTTSRTSSSTSSSGYTTTSPSYCGVSTQIPSDDEEDENSRIVGGTATRPNEFPWQALVRAQMTTGSIKYCGGSLIANRWILTATHCLLSPGQKLKSVTVFLGAHDITAYEVNRKSYSGMQVFTHPDWNQTTLAGDIALIKLYSLVTFSRYIRPICLANPIEPDYVNANVVVTGWGKTTTNSNLSPVLRKATVPVISNNQCRATYGGIVTNKIMCTSGNSYTGTCNGDGGGPMNYRQPNGRWKQIGIASFGSLGSCQSGRPYGFTRLSFYSSWVQGVISSNSVSPSPIRPTPTTPSSASTTKPSSASTTKPSSSFYSSTTTSPSSATSQTSSAFLLLLSFLSFSMNFL